ncbi:MAG: hypothetical protein FJ280_03155 [Planctomycetes bacterium]|nr:hypothetical protein [Planctomycetota bacterium]
MRILGTENRKQSQHDAEKSASKYVAELRGNRQRKPIPVYVKVIEPKREPISVYVQIPPDDGPKEITIPARMAS